MPFCSREDLKLHYEVRGDGSPLVLLIHSGASTLGWHDDFLRDLQRAHTLVLVDHRGTGQSEDGANDYLVDDLADDVAAVLDHAGISAAHLFGLSMGGTVAQAFALRHADRLRRLVLAGTFCGQRMSQPSPPWVMELYQSPPAATRREQTIRMLPIYYASRSIAEQREALCELTERATRDTPRSTLARQGRALRAFDTFEVLPSIRCPTLVVHGTEDVLIPLSAGRLLANRIPGAQLVEMTGVAHVISSEAPSALAQIVSDFLGPRPER